MSSSEMTSTKRRRAAGRSWLSPRASRMRPAVYSSRLRTGSYSQARPDFSRRSQPLRCRMSATVITVV